MHDEGRGGSPVPYAMLVLGSGARGESLLAMDQDNALLYEPHGDGAQDFSWLADFAARTCAMLNSAGLAFCPGDVMASSPQWRRDYVGWQNAIAGWVGASSPDAMLSCDIFFDSCRVHGECQSAEQLRKWAFAQAADSRMFLNFLGLHAVKASTPFGFMNRIKTDAGRIDLKLYGLLPIVSAARALAVRHGILRRSTPGRLAEAARRDAIKQQVAEDFTEAFRILMSLILRQQLADLQSGLPLGSKVEVDSLAGYDRQRLVWALRQIPDLNGVLEVPPGV